MGSHFSKNKPVAHQKNTKGQFWVDFQPNDVPFWAKLEWEHFLRINDISMDERNIDLANNMLKEEQDLLKEDIIRFHKLVTTLRMEQIIFEKMQITGEERLREKQKTLKSDQKLVDERVIRANTWEMNLKKKEDLFEKLKEKKDNLESERILMRQTLETSCIMTSEGRNGIAAKNSTGELYSRKKSRIPQRIKSGSKKYGIMFHDKADKKVGRIKPQVINSGEDQHLKDLTLKIISGKEKMLAEKKLLKTKEDEILKMETELYETMATKYGIS